jgi:hypothetical protein
MTAGFVAVWGQVAPELADELCAFWIEHKAIANPAAARARAAQAVCVARDGQGGLAGVATAEIKVLPRLRQPLYYYRQFFARALRGQRQELPFYLEAKRILREHNASLPRPESLGLLLELQNAKIASAYRHAHEPGFEATFIGYSPRGQQLRVSYFEGAVLLPPAVLPSRTPGHGRAGMHVNTATSGAIAGPGPTTTENAP